MAAVFREHARMLEGLLCRLVGPGADAEDLLQETFIQAIRGFPNFQGQASVKTWLYRIAVHVAHHHRRRPAVRRTVSLTVLPGGEDRPDMALPADVDLERREHARLLFAHLGALKPEHRVAFVLHVVEDKSMAEVAELMGASLTATKSRVFWARRKILARVRKDPALQALVGGDE
jgi:RNA polymerase sigma-70 factor (ECF subfamily)